MRIHRWPLAIAVAGIAAGCASDSAAPSASDAPESAAASYAPSSTAPTGSLGAISIRVLGDEPVFDGPDVNNDWILPGALTFDAGTYHLWGVAFDQETEEHHGYHATSPDGRSWTVDAADPLLTLGLGLENPGPVPGTVLHEPDGSWVMYLWGTPASHQRESVIFRATSPTAAGPWTADPEPILAGSPAAWDATFLDFPSVFRTADGYLMLYSGGSDTTPDRSSIGLATSTDGISWTKAPDPVIEPGLCGDFDARVVAMPRIRELDPGYLLFYAANAEGNERPQVGVAASADGRSWTCASSTPALTAADIPGSQGIHSIAVASTARGPEFIAESLGDASSSLWFGDVEMSAIP